ncbi:hypothetical protein [Bacillus paralicheniformis]|uniref:hypothetical protein n=1 Tax=Bacillus paralicheniformis TaxID=1648923 RepID=UPI0034D2FD66
MDKKEILHDYGTGFNFSVFISIFCSLRARVLGDCVYFSRRGDLLSLGAYRKGQTERLSASFDLRIH